MIALSKNSFLVRKPAIELHRSIAAISSAVKSNWYRENASSCAPADKGRFGPHRRRIKSHWLTLCGLLALFVTGCRSKAVCNLHRQLIPSLLSYLSPPMSLRVVKKPMIGFLTCL